MTQAQRDRLRTQAAKKRLSERKRKASLKLKEKRARAKERNRLRVERRKAKRAIRAAPRLAWARVCAEVKERDGNRCVVCGARADPKLKRHLNVHHLVPRQIREYWLEPLNLITLCPAEHKWHTFSFHKHPMWGALWLRKHRPEQWKWVESVTKI